MNAQCARCKKTVYPMEKLSCLDKTWHKMCFNCETCGLKLTMKTYKGYNKLPYCETHYPTTKFTSVADTPENMRLAKQTKSQSQLEYHKAHKEDLTQFSAVPDTPASETYKRNQMNVSNVVYHNKAAQRDEMEAARQAGMNKQERYQPPPAQHQQAPAQHQQAPPQHHQAPPPQPQAAPPPPPASTTKRYKALYDYAAADEDEVSFKEGDVIIDVNIIDDGWMEGRVEKTGQSGMLPSNYVEEE